MCAREWRQNGHFKIYLKVSNSDVIEDDFGGKYTDSKIRVRQQQCTK